MADTAIRYWEGIQFIQPKLFLTTANHDGETHLLLAQVATDYGHNVTMYYSSATSSGGSTVPSITGWYFSRRIAGWGNDRAYLLYQNTTTYNGIPPYKAWRIQGYNFTIGTSSLNVNWSTPFCDNFIVNQGSESISAVDLHFLICSTVPRTGTGSADSRVDFMITYYNEDDDEWQGDYYQQGTTAVDYDITGTYTLDARAFWTDGALGNTRFGLGSGIKMAGYRNTEYKIPPMIHIDCYLTSNNCDIHALSVNPETKEAVVTTETSLNFTGVTTDAGWKRYVEYVPWPGGSKLVCMVSRAIAANGGYMVTWPVSFKSSPV